MTRIVLVHGAFRGGWAWDRVVPLLARADVSVTAPTLTGCTRDSTRFGSHVYLDEWVQDVVAAAQGEDSDERLLLVAHSQGGIVTTASVEALAARDLTLLHVDAAVPLDGERGIDLIPAGAPAAPDDLPANTWIPPRPVSAVEGFSDAALRDFVNERLVPTPLGPSLEPIQWRQDIPRPQEVFAFCRHTPTNYPSWATRQRLEAESSPFTTLDCHHDAPLLHPEAVARFIVSTLDGA